MTRHEFPTFDTLCRGLYGRDKAWQIIRTVFFGSALWWSFGGWRIHEGNLKREQELDWEK